MHELMHEDSKHFSRIGEIRADDDFVVAVIGRAGMPALSGNLPFFALRCERNGAPDRLRQEKAKFGEIRSQLVDGGPKPGFATAVVVGRARSLHAQPFSDVLSSEKGCEPLFDISRELVIVSPMASHSFKGNGYSGGTCHDRII
jgi:hypothetical protein